MMKHKSYYVADVEKACNVKRFISLYNIQWIGTL